MPTAGIGGSRRTAVLSAAVTAIVTLIVAPSAAGGDELALDFTTFSATNPLGTGCVGWSFSVAEPIRVTALGYWSPHADGTPVGIFNDAGTLLAQTDVFPSDPLEGSFRCHSLETPCSLGPGQTYVIGALAHGAYAHDAAITTAPTVNYISGRQHWDTDVLEFPDQVAPEPDGRFGPSFTFAPRAETRLYWSNNSGLKIQRGDTDGSGVQDVLSMGEGSWSDGLAVDLSAAKVYWTNFNKGKIHRANLDGSGVEDLVTMSNPAGIGLDLAGGKMYWGSRYPSRICRADLDGSNVEDLVTAVVQPAGLALDVPGGKVYWADRGTLKIQRANLDGSNVEDLVTTGLSGPRGLALDLLGGKMYWAEYGEKKVQRANLDGGNVEDLLASPDVYYVYDVAVDASAGKLYVSKGSGGMSRCNLDGSSPESMGMYSEYPVALEFVELPVAGDANLDGWVEGGDYTAWADHYLSEPVPAWEDGGWLVGNFNADDKVEGGDYTIWADHYTGGGGNGGSVPEPLALSLLGLGASAVIRRKRRRQGA
jgi:hypothetical protein